MTTRIGFPMVFGRLSLGGGIGRRKGLKILRSFLHAGSNPAPGTLGGQALTYEAGTQCVPSNPDNG